MLKTQIVYRGRKPDTKELLSLMPQLDITWVKNHEPLQTVTDPFYKVRTLDWHWFRSLFQGENQIQALLLEPEELRGVGIKDHWGWYSLENDGVHDFYLTNLLRDPRVKANGFTSAFTWMFVHEYLHGAVWNQTNNKETAAVLVHEWEAKGLLKVKLAEHLATQLTKATVVNSLWQQVTKLIAMLKSISMPDTLFHPVQFQPLIISQAYGIASRRYPRTGRHIGTDYAIPIGTPLYAPWDGKVTTSGTTTTLGNFCYYEYLFKGQKWEERWCHLNVVPKLGAYKRADKVAVSGNTGQSTGPHLHREKWIDDVRIDLITRLNWANLTVDPEK